MTAEETEAMVDKTNPTASNDAAKCLITMLAIIVIIFFRIEGKSMTWEEIALFAIGILPWFSSFMDSFKFGKDGIEAVFKKLQEVEAGVKEVKEKTEQVAEETTAKINEVNETTAARISEATEATTAKIDEVKAGNEINQSINAFGTGGKPNAGIKEYKTKLIKEAEDESDPQKGKWGGNSIDETTHRKLSARIETIPNNDYFRRVILRVESTEPENFPLNDSVTFHLHPTFSKPQIEINPSNNAAEITLVAWGAFTVGAVTDNGNTKLELDLATMGNDPFFRR